MTRYKKRARTPKRAGKKATHPRARTIGLTLAAASAMAVGVWQALRGRVAARPA